MGKGVGGGEFSGGFSGISLRDWRVSSILHS